MLIVLGIEGELDGTGLGIDLIDGDLGTVVGCIAVDCRTAGERADMADLEGGGASAVGVAAVLGSAIGGAVACAQQRGSSNEAAHPQESATGHVIHAVHADSSR